MREFFAQEANRALLYRLSLAIVALAGMYDLVAPDAQDAWAEVIGTVFGLFAAGMATVNTTRTLGGDDTVDPEL